MHGPETVKSEYVGIKFLRSVLNSSFPHGAITQKKNEHVDWMKSKSLNME